VYKYERVKNREVC